jgi:hypothetical protein
MSGWPDAAAAFLPPLAPRLCRGLWWLRHVVHETTRVFLAPIKKENYHMV